MEKKSKKYDPSENDNGKVGLYEFSKVISNSLSNNSIFICDSGFIDVIMPNNIEFKKIKDVSILYLKVQWAMQFQQFWVHVADKKKI